MESKSSITIALPVFNGERYLKECIDSVISQSYSNWTLIISDNASTDKTEKICQKYAKTDNRIHYIKQEKNIGASPNFNILAKNINTTYFKWIAHDDKIEKDFLRDTINALDSEKDAPLATSRVRLIDSNGVKIEDYKTPLKTGCDNPATRFQEMLKPHRCYEIFGVIRTSFLQRTELIRNYKHGDGVLLAQLATMGKLIELPQYLMLSRQHDEQSMYLYGRDFEAYSEWFDPRNKNGNSMTFNRRFMDYLGIVLSSPMSLTGKLKCAASTIKWSYRYKRILIGEWKRLILGSAKRPSDKLVAEA